MKIPHSNPDTVCVVCGRHVDEGGGLCCSTASDDDGNHEDPVCSACCACPGAAARAAKADRESDREAEAGYRAADLLTQYRNAVVLARSLEKQLLPAFERLFERRWPTMGRGGRLTLSEDGTMLGTSCGGPDPNGPWNVSIPVDAVLKELVKMQLETEE